MENQKISLKKIINQSLSMMGGNCAKAFASSLLQFFVFLAVYLLTNSIVLSFVAWAVFIPTQTAFLLNMAENKVKPENIFNLGKNWLSYIALAIVCTICYLVGFVALIVPAFVFFVNFAFAFQITFENNLGMLEALKQSKSEAKGYRGKILLIGLIYLFIFIILVALCILLAFLASLCIQMSNLLIVQIGIFVGSSLFVIFVAPVAILSLANLKDAIAKHRLIQYLNGSEDQSKPQQEQTKTEEQQQNNSETENIVDPTDLIV